MNEMLNTKVTPYLKQRWSFLSTDERGVVTIENVPVDALAQKYGTPLFVMVESEIRSRLQRFKKAFSYQKMKVQYATKCNSNLEILKIVNNEKVDIDASSVGEIMLALLADFKPDQITFTNLYKSEQDIMFAAKLGINAITIDSAEELERVESVGEKMGLKINIFLRFNPFIEYKDYTSKYHQYGIPITMAEQVIDKAATSQYVKITGLHFHGGYVNHSKVYFLAAEKLVKLAAYIKKKYDITVKSIDLGGGIPFDEQYEQTFTPEDFGNEFSTYFEELVKKYELEMPTLIFEPGKFIVMNAGIAIMKVISRKELVDKNLVVVDGSCYSVLPDIFAAHATYDIVPVTKLNDTN
ncbi:hypothetical protein EPN87_00550, partial [archaeon]